MTLATRAAAAYKQAMNVAGETIAIRRFSGTGPSRTSSDTSVQARVIDFTPEELVGNIVQGDRKVICLVDTLSSLLPITTKDGVVIRGKELAIKAIDDNARRVGGTLIALELRVGG